MDQFCHQCGAKIASPQQKFCQQCGAVVTPQASNSSSSSSFNNSPQSSGRPLIDPALSQNVTRAAQDSVQQLSSTVNRALATGNTGQLVVIGAAGIVVAIVFVALLHALISLLPPLIIAGLIIYWMRNRQSRRRW